MVFCYSAVAKTCAQMLSTFITDLIRVEIDCGEILNEMRLLEMIEVRKVIVFLLQCSCEEHRSDVQHRYHRFDSNSDRVQLDSK